MHRLICLGDIVGYGAHPNECIELVRSLPKMNCILGNHDAAAVWRYSPYSMSRDAKEAILWTIDQLTPENSSFLQQLRPLLIMGGLCFAHANPYNPEAYRYVMTKKYALRSFASVQQQRTFIGHSHRPVVITRKYFFRIIFDSLKGEKKISLSKNNKQIINCGSVGQPRDGDPRAGYCILDTLANRVELYRLTYDYTKPAAAIRQAGLPDFLAVRLACGK